jgi:hypothetical protein
MLCRQPLKSAIVKKAPKSVQPSEAILLFAASTSPDQSSDSRQSNHRRSQPSGVRLASISGETAFIAITPTQTQATVMMTNCSTSVNTTLIMPPLTTYSVVSKVITRA